jgi:hypothetical protein
MKKHLDLFTRFLLMLLAALASNAQFTGSYGGAWSTTWNNPTSSLASVMIQGQINKKMLERSIARDKAASAGRPTPGRNRSSSSSTPSASQIGNAALGFRPVANSGVTKQIADVVGSNAQERAVLLQLFQEIKRSYETEVAKDGRSNNIAAALTFFMTAASVAYHQSGEPPENITDALLEVLQDEMSSTSDFRKMTDLEKQKMHDWLVVSGGFVLAGYLDAVQKSDNTQLSNYKKLANEFFKLVMGTGVEKFDLVAIAATPVEGTIPANDAIPVNAPATSPSAMHAADLVKEFESNEVRANQNYLGKRVRIYGEVHSVESRGGTIILIFNRTALTYTNAQCRFNQSQASGVARLNSGDRATVEGTVRGLGGGALGIKAYLIIENCSLP